MKSLQDWSFYHVYFWTSSFRAVPSSVQKGFFSPVPRWLDLDWYLLRCFAWQNDPGTLIRLTGGEGKCRAPEGYVGPCGPVESIGNLDSETKQLFEKKCNVLFPCERKCRRDYSFACPASWKNVALEKCSPGGSYAGPCREEVDFSSRTLQDKMAFEEKCLADWPCVEEKCERDFTAPCPLEWAEAHKACMAPVWVYGQC
ncbi:putative plasmodium falciparum CPW-WPC domain-containing protein [Neospora caninum Liverpool]|uniref:Plasmodium falciparum CPW-WPC domain-containing protein, putative n=1 Tax=Neospora caninum (strain Liverpool) TaxID=572307 RepID=F0VQF9_NEOCL|nr:putative plasmodium falciparum CPW-WPC domain-containing protein [Neospora caninum Liverpool]CBZ55956.1 putative plasmodium falciparum CPW-WPC domain-containing protein [Neospora caninum Liverpool]CEL70702.1 TPA: plasmodium falciparum CPW-WPC domain-containing protein, putative [Neospora caninum Liverpool]|eukprot:XP_003885982.1 putative plasmodium falciparum CPW-WPC domain-containing protein [Neospora caninum Liverpool]